MLQQRAISPGKVSGLKGCVSLASSLIWLLLPIHCCFFPSYCLFFTFNVTHTLTFLLTHTSMMWAFDSCQFVVSATGDYSLCSGDADLLVDWDKIEQVVSGCHIPIMEISLLCPFTQRLFCHQIPSCPICLDLPRAGVLTFFACVCSYTGCVDIHSKDTLY